MSPSVPNQLERCLPPGFHIHSVPTGWVVLSGAATGVLHPEQLLEQAPVEGEAFTGRGRVIPLPLKDGSRAMLRRYLRGGILGGILKDRYLGWSRPLREIQASNRALQAGVPVPEVLGALWEPTGWGWYRCALATREVPCSRDLLELYREEWPDYDREGRDRALQAVGQAIRALHDAGVEHADLHVKNVLLQGESALVIDLDNARLHPAPLSEGRRHRNLIRYHRSLKKLRVKGTAVPLRDWEQLVRGYEPEEGAGKRLEGALSRARPLHWLHAVRWRLGAYLSRRPMGV